MEASRVKRNEAASAVSAAMFVIVSMMLSPTAAWALGLFAPISTDSAEVLPKGVRSLRIAGFSTSVENTYDGYGTVQPLAYNFNKPVTVGQLIAARPTSQERGLLKGGLESEGINTTDIAGNTNGLINARVTSTVPVFAWGITDRVTLGMGLPIVNSATHVGAGWTVSGDFQNSLDSLMKKGYQAKLTSFKPLLNNVVATELSTYGYRPLVDEQHTDIGDVNLGVKVQIYKDETSTFALSPKIIAPTGRYADMDKLVDLAPGGGHWDAGLAAIEDVRVARKLTVTGSASYLYQFEQDHAYHIPYSRDEFLSPDIDWNVQQKQGDIMGVGLTGKYQVIDLFSASAGYSLQYKNPDSFQGSKYDASRYHALEVDTFQSMQALIVSFTATTIPLYRAGAFSIPLDATVSWAHVLDGRNVSLTDIGVLELASYF